MPPDPTGRFRHISFSSVLSVACFLSSKRVSIWAYQLTELLRHLEHPPTPSSVLVASLHGCYPCDCVLFPLFSYANYSHLLGTSEVYTSQRLL